MNAHATDWATGRQRSLDDVAGLCRGADRGAARALELLIREPLTPVHEMLADHGVGLPAVREAYRIAREDPRFAAVVRSPFYEHKLAYSFATTMLTQWRDDGDELLRLLRGGDGASRTVEIHPTKDSCGYKCAMCLWSDRRTDALLPLRPKTDLMSTADWLATLDELVAEGVRSVVVSGGGEPLLNPEIGTILDHCHEVGLRYDIYTTGFQLRSMSDRTLAAIGRARNLRLSIHSPFEDVYSTITGLPEHTRPLRRVLDGVQRLREAGATCAIGAGFVILPDNVGLVSDMVAFARAEQFDSLQFRAESVDATEALGAEAVALLRTQLRDVQLAALAEDGPAIDISDDLTRLANGQPMGRARLITGNCWAKAFRPTIDPAGYIAPCDLKAEPRFRVEDMFLGRIDPVDRDAFRRAAGRHVPDDCEQCMPSSRAGNLIWTKLAADLGAGVLPADQPFA
ncbi:radical SAM protein [Curtobacterium sp. NPDC087082]|uniref:radical SAM protein n=1 Tax=Curtobacterium sp. NPDC087082 TaxID=3363966 RepID=UPI0037F60E86